MIGPLPAMDHYDSLRSQSSIDLNEYLRDQGLDLDPNHRDHVRWAVGSHNHPRQWSKSRKAYNVCFILLYESFEAAMSTVGASAAIQARDELGCSRTISYFAFTATFIAGEGLAGLIFPPLSECFGRKRQYVLSSALFCLFCGLCTFSSVPGIAIARLCAGIAGGVPPSISPGSLEDLFSRSEQVWAIFLWATASNIGLVVGPIVGSYLVTVLDWRWIFYISAIYSFFIFTLSIFFHESRPNLLLSRALSRMHRETGLFILKIRNPDHHPTWHAFVTETLTRPLRLLCTQPIIIIASSLNTLAFSLIYALTEALPIIYPSFGLTTAQSSLAFIPVLIGILLSTALRILDHARLLHLQKHNKPLRPEHKIKSLLISSPALLVGLWIFAWTIPPLVTDAPFLISMAALIPVGLASNDFDAVIAGYLVDVYAEYAASAFASVTWTRAVFSVVFSLVTDGMFRGLGSNGAASILAGGAVGVCAGAVGLYYSGGWLRKRSRFARQCEDGDVWMEE